MTGETGRKNKILESCVSNIEKEIECVRSDLKESGNDIDDIKKSVGDLANKVSTSCLTSDYATTDSLNVLSKANAACLEATNAKVGSLEADSISVANAVDCLKITDVCIGKISGLSSIDQINAKCVVADSVDASTVNGAIVNNKSVTSPLFCGGDVEANSVKTEDLNSDSIEAKCVDADSLEATNGSVDTLSVSNATIGTSIVTKETVDDFVASSIANSKLMHNDCVALSKYIALSNFNGQYNVEVKDVLDINVVGSDGMYLVNFSNKDPETLMNVSATDCNNGLILELNDCLIGCQACYMWKSVEEPDIRYEANYDYYRCDKSVPTCNNLWSKHFIFVGRRALDNGVEVAGCLHAECIKLDNPIVDNILVTDSLTSYRNNCLGDLYVFPLEIATGCCSYGKGQIADYNPHEVVCTEDGRCYCLDNSTNKMILDTNAICMLDVASGAISDDDVAVSGCTKAVCSVAVCLSRDGLDLNGQTCLDNTHLTTGTTTLDQSHLSINDKVVLDCKSGLNVNNVSCLDNDKVKAMKSSSDTISDYDDTCSLATFDGTNWNILSCGKVQCAVCDNCGCVIDDEYVHCVDKPVKCATVIEGANKEKCLKVDYICKDTETTDLTTGLVCKVDISEEDQVQCLNVECVNSDKCQYVIDSRAVLECDALPAAPLNKVYNIDDRHVYSKATRLATYQNLDEVCCIHNSDCSICIATLDSSIAAKGNASLSGDLTINGNIYQCGSSYTTHAEDLNVNDATITVRANAESAMVAGDYAGITVSRYDGTNDMDIFVDNEGVARLGKTDSLQPFALRNEEANMTDGALVCWNATDKRIDTACSIDCYVCSLICDVSNNDCGFTEYTRVNGCTVIPDKVGIVCLTQEEYDAMTCHNPSTLYLIKDGEDVSTCLVKKMINDNVISCDTTYSSCKMVREFDRRTYYTFAIGDCLLQCAMKYFCCNGMTAFQHTGYEVTMANNVMFAKYGVYYFCPNQDMRVVTIVAPQSGCVLWCNNGTFHWYNDSGVYTNKLSFKVEAIDYC